MTSEVLDKSQEHADIRAVRGYIKREGPVSEDELVEAKPGPTTDDELEHANISREEQIDRIVTGLLDAGEIEYVGDGWVSKE